MLVIFFLDEHILIVLYTDRMSLLIKHLKIVYFLEHETGEEKIKMYYLFS